jgi:hypothetical protein
MGDRVVAERMLCRSKLFDCKTCRFWFAASAESAKEKAGLIRGLGFQANARLIDEIRKVGGGGHTSIFVTAPVRAVSVSSPVWYVMVGGGDVIGGT